MVCVCAADGDDRLQVGKVILLEDEENGGMKTRTFVNATFRKCMYVLLSSKLSFAAVSVNPMYS